MSSIHKAWDCAQRWEREKALELLADVPENGFKMEIGLIYGGLGELDRAFEYLDEAFAEHPTSLRDLPLHGWAADLHQDPRFDELIEKLGKLGYPTESPIGSLKKAWSYAQEREREKALALLTDVLERGYTMEIGLIYGELGELDRAFEYLDRAFAYHPTSLRSLSLHPWAAGLRQDPRFDGLIEKLENLKVQ